LGKKINFALSTIICVVITPKILKIKSISSLGLLSVKILTKLIDNGFDESNQMRI